MPAQPDLTDRDYEALSAYLDDMLDSAERAELEARLQDEPLLRRELDSLRQTVDLIQALPPMRAPRDFTLTPDMVADPRPQLRLLPRSQPTLWFSAAAALVALVIGGVLVINLTSRPAQDDNPPAVAVLPTSTADPALFDGQPVVRSEQTAEAEDAMRADPLQSAEEALDFDFDGTSAADDDESRIGDKVFRLEDEVWVDADYDPETMEAKPITREDALYADLVEQEPLVADYAELGPNVIFVVDDQAYQLGPE